jgi:hypothetical protein
MGETLRAPAAAIARTVASSWLGESVRYGRIGAISTPHPMPASVSVVGLAAGLSALGAAIEWWIFLIGMLTLVFTTIGFVFEYYRGEFKH